MQDSNQLVGLVMAALYFLPSILSDYTRARNKGLIVGINFFFGWTLLGWFLPLIWAFIWRQDQVEVLQPDGTKRMVRISKKEAKAAALAKQAKE